MLILTFFSVLAANAQDKTEVIEVSIEPYKSLTYGAFFKHLRLNSKDEPGIEFIEGFEFSWGYHYKLQVEKTTLEQPPMDGSSVVYKLKKIISKKIGAEQLPGLFDYLLGQQVAPAPPVK